MVNKYWCCRAPLRNRMVYVPGCTSEKSMAILRLRSFPTNTTSPLVWCTARRARFKPLATCISKTWPEATWAGTGLTGSLNAGSALAAINKNRNSFIQGLQFFVGLDTKPVPCKKMAIFYEKKACRAQICPRLGHAFLFFGLKELFGGIPEHLRKLLDLVFFYPNSLFFEAFLHGVGRLEMVFAGK